jgi:predicted phage terminase large subunit-like protein
MDEGRNHARAESERRRRRRLREFPGYGDWLRTVSPEMCWDYAWLKYVNNIYDLVTAGIIKKLMIFAPPQHGKSTGGTIRYPVMRLERDPRTRCIVATHSQRLANRFSRQSLAIAKRRMAISKKRQAQDEWETEAGGGMKAVGAGGAIAGTSADITFIDDPIRNREAAESLLQRDKVWDWFNDEIVTRTQEHGSIILQMTRRHEDDLAGRILASEDGPNWNVVILRALAEEDDPLGRPLGAALCPERFSRETLLNRQMTMRLGFEAHYQQRPTPAGGSIFLRDWFKIERMAAILNITQRNRYWDLAATEGDGDFTVGCKQGKVKDGQIWVEDVVRGQWAPANRDRKILTTAEADGPSCPQTFEQQPGSAGITERTHLARLLDGHNVTFIPSVGSKMLRAEPWAAQLGADNVRLAAAGKWQPSFIAEHLAFDKGVHDDQVDAASGAHARNLAKRQVKWA